MGKTYENRETAFLLAANALYLARDYFLIQRHELPPEERRMFHKTEMRDYSSFCRLRDVLSVPGLVDDRLEPPFDDKRKFPWMDDEIKNLIKSDSTIARVAFRDIPFTEGENERLFQANGGRPCWSDWAMPICRWAPGEVIWEARTIMVEYFKELDSGFASENWEKSNIPTMGAEKCAGGPRDAVDRNREKAAKAVLEEIFGESAMKAVKDDVLTVVHSFVGSKKAAKRVWDQAEVGEWKSSGRPDQTHKMSIEDFRSAFDAKIVNQSPPVS